MKALIYLLWCGNYDDLPIFAQWKHNIFAQWRHTYYGAEFILWIECDSELIDVPWLVQSMLHHGTFQNFDLSVFAQNVTYLVFRPHERYNLTFFLVGGCRVRDGFTSPRERERLLVGEGEAASRFLAARGCKINTLLKLMSIHLSSRTNQIIILTFIGEDTVNTCIYTFLQLVPSTSRSTFLFI